MGGETSGPIKLRSSISGLRLGASSLFRRRDEAGAGGCWNAWGVGRWPSLRRLYSWSGLRLRMGPPGSRSRSCRKRSSRDAVRE